jgi:hypothetical protein
VSQSVGCVLSKLRLHDSCGRVYSGALRSLQKAAGIYGFVAPSTEVQFPGAVVGHLSGGECLRSLLPKTPRITRACKKSSSSSSIESEVHTPPNSSSRYCLQLTYDVPQETYNGMLHVRVCWHEVIFRADVNFGASALAF